MAPLTTVLALLSLLGGHVAHSDSDFVTVGANHLHFQAGDSSFVPIGLNIAWPDKHSGTSTEDYYEEYFSDLSASGGNVARVWLGPNLVDSFNPLALLYVRRRRSGPTPKHQIFAHALASLTRSQPTQLHDCGPRRRRAGGLAGRVRREALCQAASHLR